MVPLQDSDFNALSSEKLAERIDRFFYEDEQNRYAGQIQVPIVASAKAILASEAVQLLDEREKRHALLLFYRSLFQVSVCMQNAAFGNTPDYGGPESNKWNDPLIQIRYATGRQGQIVAARISFECLMEFVFYSMERKLIPSNKSKLGKFRKWLSQPSNRFRWLIFYLVVINRFEQRHRTPEVHGTSYIAVDALRNLDHPRQQSELDVVNLMLNIWPQILITLNGGTVKQCSYTPGNEAVFEEFFSWEKLDMDDFWKRFLI